MNSPKRTTKGVDHIDPLKNDFVCGFDSKENTIEAPLAYNKAKSNAFIPYRINYLPAPIKFGNTAEFLIKGKWVICKFGSTKWWDECKRIGYARTNVRGTSWFHDPVTLESFMLPAKDAMKRGLVQGRINYISHFPGVSAIKGKKLFHNITTGEHRYFDSNPGAELWKEGECDRVKNLKSKSQLNREPRVKNLSENQQLIVSLYNKGMSTTHLALLFESNHRSVANYLRQWGVPLRARSANKHQRELSKKLYIEQTNK